jgi:hypothetical protein
MPLQLQTEVVVRGCHHRTYKCDVFGRGMPDIGGSRSVRAHWPFP